MKAIQLAIVTGQHPFEVQEFQRMLNSFDGIESFPQNMEFFVNSERETRQSYDVILFYNFHRQTPGITGKGFDLAMKQTLEELGETPQGILILHHAILAFPDWGLWSELTGIRRRSHSNLANQTVRAEVVNHSHPVTAGMQDWEMVDETYVMNNPSLECTPLLVTRHPLSMRVLAWTKTYRQARVLCYQSGHDHKAYQNPSYRQFLRQGIYWLAGR